MNHKSGHKEDLETVDRSLFLLSTMLDESLTFQEVSDLFPGVFHINSLEDLTLQFFDKGGEDIYKCPFEEVREKGLSVMQEVIHPDEFISIPSRLKEFVLANDERSTFSFFQRLKGIDEDHYEWYFTSCKLSKYGLLSISHPIRHLHTNKSQIEMILEENAYYKKHFKKFMSLTKREKEVLRELAVGKTAPQISDEFCISVNTVKTHRQRIFDKLEVRTFTELFRYAFYFDLL